MSHLVETMCIMDGEVQRLDYHQERYDKTMATLFAKAPKIKLKDHLFLAKFFQSDTTKCRVVYHHDLVKVQYQPYHKPQINGLQMVIDDAIYYEFKTVDRPQFTALKKQMTKGVEMLIVKNGHFTDGYYYNLVFENESGLFTPRKPLLRGVMRQWLLDQKTINEAEIIVDELENFKKIHLINALNPLGSLVFDCRKILIAR